MAKGQTQQATSMANDTYKNVNQQGQKTQDYLWGQLPAAQAQSQDTYNKASGAFSGFTGGYGSYDPTAYEEVSSQNKSNIATGGYDPAKMSQLQKGYTDLTANGMGGINPDQAAKIRSGYENLASTGGISDDTANSMRRESASNVQGIYSTLGSNLARTNRAQGITAGGETAQMARQAAEESAKATTGVNAQVGQLRQQGTIAGLGGLSNFEQGAASGQREALAGESSLATSEAQGRLSASAAQQELASGAAQQRIQAAGGLANLYSSAPGYVTSLVQQIMQSQSVTGQLTTEQTQIMQELAKTPGLFDNIMKGISVAAGAASGVGGAYKDFK